MDSNPDAWWDRTWNTTGGCTPVSPGCKNCYAKFYAGTHTLALHNDLAYKTEGGRFQFNGKLASLPAENRLWSMPLRWKGAANPKLGPGQPSLIFVGDMSDVFHEDRPVDVIDKTVGVITSSDHIGLLLTKRPQRMAAYFKQSPPNTLQRRQQQLWLGFSAERQKELGERWPHTKTLADAGWNIFASVAPLIAPVKLPADFLRLGDRAWCIVAGEQGPHGHDCCADLDPNWARAIRDQCSEAGVTFFMKQMARGKPIPPDLQIRDFPARMRRAK
jgi:protein gp37